MFPLVHYFVNHCIYQQAPFHGPVPTATALGGMWPDLAAAAGCDRNQAHEMGDHFYRWCEQHAPHGKDLARGIISHCSEPKCVDYYADEFCPGYHKGWCFKLGEPYMPEVAAATGLPEKSIWWKSHNFVEMSYELMTDAAHPALKQVLLTVLADQAAIADAAEILSAYSGRPKSAIIAAYESAPTTFALTQITPEELSQKQHLSFIRRFAHDSADLAKMAALLRKMQTELAATYQPMMELLVTKTAEVLSAY